MISGYIIWVSKIVKSGILRAQSVSLCSLKINSYAEKWAEAVTQCF